MDASQRNSYQYAPVDAELRAHRSAPARIPRTAERKTVSPASVRPRPAPMHRGKSAYSGSSGTPWSREISSSSPSERPRDSRPSTRPWSTSRACTVRNGPSGYAAQADTGDEHLADGLLSGLQYLALHTRDRAAASGNALLRATVQPVTAECPPSSCTTVTTTPPSLSGARARTEAVSASPFPTWTS